jgi:LmbE family N-acetylglucosaminyl deacetylase
MMKRKLLEILHDTNEIAGGGGSWLGCVKAERVLIIAPHPDDEVVGCGGIILKYLNQGAKVTIVVVTNGEYGNFAQESINRQIECTEAWSGHQNIDICFWEQEDSHIESTVINNYVDIIREICPHVIYVPWFMDRHIDHFMVNSFLKKALDKLTDCKCICAFYEVLYPLYANKTTNITSVFMEKISILRKYKSQIGYLNLENVVRCQAELRAAHIRLKKVQYAEAFFVGTVQMFKDIIEISINDE